MSLDDVTRSEEMMRIEEELGLLRARLGNMQRGAIYARRSFFVYVVVSAVFVPFLLYWDFTKGVAAFFLLAAFFLFVWVMTRGEGAWLNLITRPRHYSRTSYAEQVENWIRTREKRLAELKRQA